MPFIKNNINKFKGKSGKNTLTLISKLMIFSTKKKKRKKRNKQKTSLQTTEYNKGAIIFNKPNPNGTNHENVLNLVRK